MTKRTISFLLTILILLCSVACKKQETTTSTTTEAIAKVIEKPKSITVMWDNTMPTADNKGEIFAKELSKELGIEIRLITPNVASYYDVLESYFVSDTVPDVFVLSADKYAHYAKTGALWDMKEAWDNSELKMSGGLEEWAINIQENLVIEGNDHKEGMYGFSIRRYSRYATIVKTAWLEECNLEAPKNYEEYLNMCKAFKNKYNVPPVWLNINIGSAKSSNPEIWQDAQLDFYRNEEGKWVDGFTEERTKKAMLRLKELREADLVTKSNSTAMELPVTEKFCVGDIGVFGATHSYITAITKKDTIDNRITILEPIEEVGNYYEKPSYVLSIYSKANNPEGIFKYFIESIYDGGKVQSLWMYGVEGVHWNYVDGSLTGYNCIHPNVSLGVLDTSIDPATKSKIPVQSEEMKKFNSIIDMSVKPEPVIYDCTGIEDEIEMINIMRQKIITSIYDGNYDGYNMSVDELYDEYNEKVGHLVEECLRILNE